MYAGCAAIRGLRLRGIPLCEVLCYSFWVSCYFYGEAGLSYEGKSDSGSMTHIVSCSGRPCSDRLPDIFRTNNGKFHNFLVPVY